MTLATIPHRLAEQDLAQLRGLTDAWMQACYDRDWDTLLTLVTDDIAFLAPDVPAVLGKEALRAYCDAFPTIKDWGAEVLAAEGTPDLASARGTVEMTVETAPGQTVRMKGKWAATYRKHDTGTWLCASDAWNLDAAPAPA
jgi:ketosteroid isomerase-like protein